MGQLPEPAAAEDDAGVYADETTGYDEVGPFLAVPDEKEAENPKPAIAGWDNSTSLQPAALLVGPLLLPSPPHWLLLRWRHSSALLQAAMGLRQVWHHSTRPQLWIPRRCSHGWRIPRWRSHRRRLGDPSRLGSEFFLPRTPRRDVLLPAQQGAMLQRPWPHRPVYYQDGAVVAMLSRGGVLLVQLHCHSFCVGHIRSHTKNFIERRSDFAKKKKKKKKKKNSLVLIPFL